MSTMCGCVVKLSSSGKGTTHNQKYLVWGRKMFETSYVNCWDEVCCFVLFYSLFSRGLKYWIMPLWYNLYSLVYDFMPIVTVLISEEWPFTKMNVTWILAFCAIAELHFGMLTDPSFNDMKCKIFKCTIFAGAGWNIVVNASFTHSIEKGHGKWLYSRNSFRCICNSTQWRCGKEACSVSTP